MSGGYQPKVLYPNLNLPQMKSEGFQKPFYFGGSSAPSSLGLSQSSFSGSGTGKPFRQHKTLPVEVSMEDNYRRSPIIPFRTNIK